MEGWIKLHRKITEWEWYNDSNTFRLFLHILLKANRDDNKWRGTIIKRGQLFTSVSHLSRELKISEKSIRNGLLRLSKSSELGIQGASNGTMITISKYEDYQQKDDTKGKQSGKRGANDGRTKGDKQEGEEYKNINNSTLWRENFEIYLKEMTEAYLKLKTDKFFINAQQDYYPGIDIPLSLQKSVENFWGLPAGWENKKKSKIKTPDWAETFKNTLSQKQNQVYKKRQTELQVNENLFKTPDKW